MATKKYESYFARKGAQIKAAKAVPPPLGMAAAAAPPFTIEVRFLGGLTTAQKNAFKAAANRWTKVIVGDLPSVTVDGELIDDLLILAQGTPIDGAGSILGQAGPTHLRPASAGAAAMLPAKGIMSFDTADLAQMAANGTLGDVIAHEMGHVIGIGTIWSRKNLIVGSGTNNPTFKGAAAKAEFKKLTGASGAAKNVPIENTGGPGTREGHWRESVFNNELMSGFIAASNNPLSRLTVASLQDLGYTVDLAKAEAYKLPNLFNIAAAAEPPKVDLNRMLTNIPVELPAEAMTN